MKMHTEVAAKFESKGKPKLNEKHNGTVREIIMAYAKWMSRVYMGSHLQVTIARNESELAAITQGKAGNHADADLALELEYMLAQESLELDEDDEPGLLDNDS